MAEDLDFHRLQGDVHGVQWAGTGSSVGFVHLRLVDPADGVGRRRGWLVAVGDLQFGRDGRQREVHDDVHGDGVLGVGVGHDENFFVGQDAGEGQDAGLGWREPEGVTVARQRPKVRAAVPQGRVGGADPEDLLAGEVEGAGGDRSRVRPTAPRGRFVAAPGRTGPARCRSRGRGCRAGLARQARPRLTWSSKRCSSAGLDEPDALLHVVVVQERDEESGGVAVGAEHVALELLAQLEHADQPGGGGEALGDRRQLVEERVVERGVDADQIAGVVGVAADEPGDVLLGVPVEDFAVGEEVLLADGQGELADGIAEQSGQIALQVAQGVDAEPVDVEPGDDVLVGLDQQVLELGVIGAHLLERLEVADGVVAARLGCALPAKEGVVLQLARPHVRVTGRVHDVLDRRQARVGIPGPVAPSDRLGVGGEASLGAVGGQARGVLWIALVREHITDVVEDDVEDDVQTFGMRGIHQLAQLRVRVRRVLGEPGLGADEVMDAIPVVVGRKFASTGLSQRAPTPSCFR